MSVRGWEGVSLIACVCAHLCVVFLCFFVSPLLSKENILGVVFKKNG